MVAMATTCSVVSVKPAFHCVTTSNANAFSASTGRHVWPPRLRRAASAASAASAVAWPLTYLQSMGSLTRPKAAFLSGADAFAAFSRKYSSTALSATPGSRAGVFAT
jgi:hypothetical protein